LGPFFVSFVLFAVKGFLVYIWTSTEGNSTQEIYECLQWTGKTRNCQSKKEGRHVQNYKLVIFDFDGTLADSFRWFVSTVNQVAERFRFKQLDLKRLEEFRTCSARQMMVHAQLSMWKLPRVTREMRRLMTERIDEVRLFDDVDAVLKRLDDANVNIAVVTSNAKENVLRVLGAENAALIKHFGCGASLFGKKGKVKAAAKAFGVSLGEVLCVADEIRDAEMAASLGVDFAGVSWGYTKPEVLQKYSPIPVLKQMRDVLSMVIAP
jgi:phosphoglycolate phosphatase